MMRLAVIAGELLAAADVAQGVELNALIGEAHEGVRGAGMVEVLQAATFGEVQGPALVEFDQIDGGLFLHPAASGAGGDPGTGEVPDLAPAGDGAGGEGA